MLFYGLVLLGTQLLPRLKFYLWCDLIEVRSESKVFEVSCEVWQPALDLTLKLVFLSSCLIQLFVDSEVGLKNSVVDFQQLLVSKFSGIKCCSLFEDDTTSRFQILTQFLNVFLSCLFHYQILLLN